MVPRPLQPPRLDENSPAVKLLRKRFKSGEITADDDARSVQATDALFLQYKPDTFRTRFNRMKKEYAGEEEEGMFFL